MPAASHRRPDLNDSIENYSVQLFGDGTDQWGQCNRNVARSGVPHVVLTLGIPRDLKLVAAEQIIRMDEWPFAPFDDGAVFGSIRT